MLVRDFVNTVEWQEDHDTWTTPLDLQHWFARRAGLGVGALADADLHLARSLREGLRSVLLRHGGHEPLPDAEDHLNRTLRRIPLRLHVSSDGRLSLGDGAGRDPADPLAFVLSMVDSARVDGTWERLKVCSRDSCRWAYWDSTRNRSGRWCAMTGCGNYVKMRTRNGKPLGPDELATPSGQPRPARLVDVAARAGVSIKTVSNVVTGAGNVTPGTRSRVEAAVRELGYQPNLEARALRRRRELKDDDQARP
jgi:predicted RNA-binding Zn ribbon-like protein